MIFKAYKYLFFVTYLWQKKMWGRREPEQWALLGISFICLLNFYMICTLAVFLGFHVVGEVVSSHVFSYTLMVAIPVINHFIFIWNDNYKKIVKEFKNREYSEKHDVTIFWIYLVFSFIGLGVGGVLMAVSLKTGFTVFEWVKSLL